MLSEKVKEIERDRVGGLLPTLSGEVNHSSLTISTLIGLHTLSSMNTVF